MNSEEKVAFKKICKTLSYESLNTSHIDRDFFLYIVVNTYTLL